MKRDRDGHLIHANVDTDIIVAEEMPYGSLDKPDEIYSIIEVCACDLLREQWLAVGVGRQVLLCVCSCWRSLNADLLSGVPCLMRQCVHQ